MGSPEWRGFLGQYSSSWYEGDDLTCSCRERGMSRFYILLEGDITQAKAEASVRAHMAPHKVEFVKTEWFSTFDSMFPPIIEIETHLSSQGTYRRDFYLKVRQRSDRARRRRRARPRGQWRPRAQHRHCRRVRSDMAARTGCQGAGRA